MSERQPNYETGKNSELDSRQLEKHSQRNAEKINENAEKAAENDLRNSLEAIQERVEKAASESAEVAAESARSETVASQSPLSLGTQFKGQAYKQEMRRVQRREKPAERAFSKIIHQPVVEEISNIAESTIARPSGLLFAGIFSVITSLAVLWISRHYGYEYNFMIGLLSLAGGFGVGLVVEGVGRALKRPK